MLLDGKAGVDFKCSDETTPLILATQHVNCDIVSKLLQEGANVNATDKQGYSPLIVAVLQGSSKIVSALLKAGASTETSTNDGYNPLLIASANGRAEIVSMLIGAGANVNAVDQSGQSPLHKAMEIGCEETMSLLLQHGADVKQVDNKGRTPTVYAAQHGQANSISMVLNLVNKYCSGDTDMFEKLIGDALFAAYSEVLRREYTHFLPWPGSKGIAAVIHTLLAAGEHKATDYVLLKASKEGHETVVLNLVKYGACVNICDSQGNTPLMYAVLEGNINVV